MIKVFFNPKFCQNDSAGDAIKLIIASSEMKVRGELLGTTQEKTQLREVRQKEEERQIEGKKERQRVKRERGKY